MGPRTGFVSILLLVAVAVAAHELSPIAPRIEQFLDRATDGQVRVAGLDFTLSGDVSARRVELRDAGGVWLGIDDVAVQVEPKRLWSRELHLDRLTAAAVQVARLPQASGGGAVTLPVRIVLDAGHIDRLHLAPALAGQALGLSVDANGQLTTSLGGTLDITARPLAEPGIFHLAGQLDAATLHAKLQADEPAGGLIARLAALPNAGALAIEAEADGPWSAATTRLRISAGDLRLEASGQMDITGHTDDVTLTATAPAMAPRPDLSWQAVTLQAHLTGAWDRPHATGTLGVDRLAAAGATLERLDAELTGDLGHLATSATLTGLNIPGPRPDLFATAPVTLRADIDLAAPDRPVQLDLSHPLLDATGTVHTAGDLSADMTFHLPDLAALQPDVHGSLTVASHLLGPLGAPSLQADITGDVAAAGLPTTAISAALHGHGLPPAMTAELTATGTGPGQFSLTAALDEQARATLHLDGRNVGPVDTMRLDAEGTPQDLALKLAAAVAGVQATATATLDAPAQRLTLSALQADWRDQRVTLLAPARVSFADGVAVDRLRLGSGPATLDVAGRVAPALDLTATLRGVPAALAGAIVPDLEGTVDGTARLTGTPQRPAGTVRLTANGLHVRTGPAAAFPPATATATATLAGTTVRLDANATLASAHLSIAGTAPLSPAGSLALRATGGVDLALFDRVLAAGGRRVRGHAIMDAAIAGTPTAPRLTGTLALAGGDVQDAVFGLRIHAVTARLRADGDAVRIEQFSGTAGVGTITARGNVGLAAPMPVDITVTAHNATPVASDPFTAVIDGDIAVRGALADHVAASGTVNVQRADIRVAERQPAGVAVLNVVGRNLPPPPPPGPDLALDIAVKAPGRVFVRGHGLDAELAGTITVRGTAARPRPEGTLTLVRGTFNLIGQTLTFSSGTIHLDGSGRIDPSIDLIANSTNGGVTATLEITGYASALKFTLSATPPLPQDEILSRLLFGTSVTSLGALQLAEIAAGLAELSGVGSGLNPLDRLRTSLGLDRLTVTNGQGTGTAVEAGRSIAPGVYIGARQSTSGNGTTGTLQIDLGHGLKLQTDIGTAANNTATTAPATASTDTGGTNVGIVWQFEY